jgi:hypothetical protein
MTRRAQITWTLLLLAAGYTLLFRGRISYPYVSSDGGFRDIEVPFKGRHLPVVTAHFDKYRQNGHPDAVLMRCFDREWWFPSLWIGNFTDERWKLPRAPAELEPGK